MGMEAVLAENPDVQLLDVQVADWTETKAFEITSAWLNRFDGDTKGIWAVNDPMAIGALEALRAEGLAGQIPITGIDGIKQAVDAIAAGKFDPGAEPKEHREFYGIGVPVTFENGQDYIKNHVETTPTYDFTDLWGRVSGRIHYRS